MIVNEDGTGSAPLVKDALYEYNGILMIATSGTQFRRVFSSEVVDAPVEGVHLKALPGGEEWSQHMVDLQRAAIKDLENERRELNRMYEWRADLGQAILAKAEEHDWCEEYDDFAEEWDLPQREYEYDVTVSVRVRARNEERAEELVSENIDLNCYNDVFVVAGPDYSTDRAY